MWNRKQLKLRGMVFHEQKVKQCRDNTGGVRVWKKATRDMSLAIANKDLPWRLIAVLWSTCEAKEDKREVQRKKTRFGNGGSVVYSRKKMLFIEGEWENEWQQFGEDIWPMME